MAPTEHRNALDLDRTVVVGNRGVGKTFWSQALVDPVARLHVAKLYPRLELENTDAEIGFTGGYSSGFTASEQTIADAEASGASPVRIWEAILLRFVAGRIGLDVGDDLVSVVRWLSNNSERGEQALRRADKTISDSGRRFLLVFDGLDALGNSWSVIRTRLDGLIRLARLSRSFRAIRLKIFLRLDQAEDELLWQSPDASKLYNERVRLRWEPEALYDLLFFHLFRSEPVRAAFDRLFPNATAASVILSKPKEPIFGSSDAQRVAFTALAGQSMGGGTNRGNTYNWVVNHLADAHGETTPRAFLVALSQAAKHPSSRGAVIDHLGIQAGVREASERRLRELQEDYWWIDTGFQPLAGATVPCDPHDFIYRWKNEGTVRKIRDRAKREGKLPPISWETQQTESKEDALLATLKLIGVIEERTNGKINMPDIFRVAANIKRKGGVAPPPRTSATRRTR